MKLEDIWKKLEEERLEIPSPERVNPWKSTSRHPVEKLKRAYLYSTGFSVFFLLLFVAMIFVFPHPLVKAGIALVVAGYVFFLVTNLSMYRHINRFDVSAMNLKSTLQETYDIIRENIRFQEKAALLIYPVATAAGFLMGAAASGADISKFIQRTEVPYILAGLTIILTPIAYYAARWLHKVSYGACLTQLRELILNMESTASA